MSPFAGSWRSRGPRGNQRQGRLKGMQTHRYTNPDTHKTSLFRSSARPACLLPRVASLTLLVVVARARTYLFCKPIRIYIYIYTYMYPRDSTLDLGSKDKKSFLSFCALSFALFLALTNQQHDFYMHRV